MAAWIRFISACWCLAMVHSGHAAVLRSSTYLGGNGTDWIGGMELAPDGTLTIAGYTSSTNLATTPGALQPARAGGLWDCFVARLSADGSELLMLTYLGGTDLERALDLTHLPDGGIVVVGSTQSNDFPGVETPGRSGHEDPFVVVLEPDGTSLRYTRVLRSPSSLGAHVTEWRAVAIGAAGEIHVYGRTRNRPLPVLEPVQAEYGGGVSDGFLATYSPDGDLLQASYLGGLGREIPYDLAVAPDGRLIVIGETDNADYPQVGPPWPGESCTGSDCGFDGFITVLSPDGGEILASRRVGGMGHDGLNHVRALPDGRIQIVGNTQGGFPTRTSLPAVPASPPSGLLLELQVDDLRMTAAVGLEFWADSLASTLSGSLVLLGEIDRPVSWLREPVDDVFAGPSELMMMVVDPCLEVIEQATYLGGSDEESGVLESLLIDSNGEAWVGGSTRSRDFPTLTPVQPWQAGDRDGVLARLGDLDSTTPTPTPLGNLRLRHAAGRVGVEVDAPPIAAELLLAQGDLDSLRVDRAYSHGVVACAAPGDELGVDSPDDDVYFLAFERSCGTSLAGVDSSGSPRPAWVAGTGACP
ncbi:MAG: hypothetical protein AAF533_01165 [Acidobacteriota bacterium]